MKVFIKKENDCSGCPYLNTPACDLDDIDQYYTCRLTYANTYILEHFQDVCPMKTIQTVLTDFMCFLLENGYLMEDDMSNKKELIENFIKKNL